MKDGSTRLAYAFVTLKPSSGNMNLLCVSACKAKDYGSCRQLHSSALPTLISFTAMAHTRCRRTDFDVVVVRTPAGLRAFEGRCPHQGALLGEGELDGDKLVCRNHHWRFSVDSGKREGGLQCLVSCPVVERERAVFVDVSGLSRGPGRIVAKRTLDDLPGPRGLPFLGNTHQLDVTKLHLTLERWAAQYGPVYLFRMGSSASSRALGPEVV